MARATINEHPDRGRIEFDLARGVPVRAVAKKYGVNMHALYRLLKKLPPQLKAAHMGARLKAGTDLEKLRPDESEAKPLARRKPDGWLAIRNSTVRLSAATGIETLKGLLRFLGGGGNVNDA